jgi:hypothetical protein
MGQGFAEEREHGSVKLLRSLQRSEMAHAVEENEFRVGDASSEIFRVFAFDEFVMLALPDHHGHADPREVVREIVRFRPPIRLTSSAKVLKCSGVADSSAWSFACRAKRRFSVGAITPSGRQMLRFCLCFVGLSVLTRQTIVALGAIGSCKLYCAAQALARRRLQ